MHEKQKLIDIFTLLIPEFQTTESCGFSRFVLCWLLRKCFLLTYEWPDHISRFKISKMNQNVQTVVLLVLMFAYNHFVCLADLLLSGVWLTSHVSHPVTSKVPRNVGKPQHPSVEMVFARPSPEPLTATHPFDFILSFLLVFHGTLSQLTYTRGRIVSFHYPSSTHATLLSIPFYSPIHTHAFMVHFRSISV